MDPLQVARAIRSATEDVAWAATEATTRSATWDATWDATGFATEAATWAATREPDVECA